MADEEVTYGGKEADVRWNGKLCIHIGECGRAAGDLFVGGRKPWCQPDLVQIRQVVDVVERCPTGALTYERKDGGTAEQPAEENTVVVQNRGPLYVRGNLDIEGATDAMPGVRFRAALCRCGESKNKPFCDNAHETAGFSDYGAVGQTGEGCDGKGGTLVVKAAEDGPLLLQGKFRLLASSGRVAFEGQKAALCRCGHSKNKPFCDGAHKAAGFRS
ncbi:MAG: CDGSH iron-sulfur domain-containing protein [Myxococcales bacterium]|nr:CDGSH iron-sulfur domain-containing protein [Myxococcales bacterium]MDD9970922.1 CDGSH iron-sulfur domain-containing protein [Myxococcales bacterium]